MSDKDPRLSIPEQSSEYPTLDLLDSILDEVDFDREPDFERGFFTNTAPEQPHQFDKSLLEPFAIVNVDSSPRILDGIYTEPNHASSDQRPLSIHPRDLVLPGNGIGEVASELPEAVLNYAAPSVALNDAAPRNQDPQKSGSQPSISYKFMERYKFSSRNLLSHFRYGLKGPVPFTLDWNKESNKKLGELDRDAVAYVRFVSSIAIRRRDEFEENARRVKNGEYEGEMFWLSQMLIALDLEDDDGQTP